MSTPTEQMPHDVSTLQTMLKTAVAKLMAHSQTVQELIKANMELRAALHLTQTDKNHLEEYIKTLVNPVVVEEPAVAENDNGAVHDDLVDANSVQA